MTAPAVDLISFDTITDEIRALAEEHPYKTASCSYFSEGQPCCIVGHVLAQHGVGPADKADDGYTYGIGIGGKLLAAGGTLAQDLPWGSFGIERPRFDDLRLEWVQTVQFHQDNGKTWGEAVAIADEEIGLPGLYDDEIEGI